MTTKGGDRTVLGFVFIFVSQQYRFLRIGIGQLFCDHQRRRRQTHPFRRIASQVNKGFRGHAMGLVEGQGDAELLDIPGNDSWGLTEAKVDDRLRLRGANLGQLGRHVAVLVAVELVGDEGHAILGRQFEQLLVAGFVEAAIASDQRHLGQAALAQILVDFGDGHAIRMRGLEHPFLDRFDNFYPACQRNERNAFLFHVRDNCHGVAGSSAADDQIHLVIFNQALGEVDCVLGVAAGVVVDQFEFPALDAAFGVDVLNVHLQGFQFGIAQERSGAGYGQERADPDRFGGAGQVNAGQQ